MVMRVVGLFNELSYLRWILREHILIAKAQDRVVVRWELVCFLTSSTVVAAKESRTCEGVPKN